MYVNLRYGDSEALMNFIEEDGRYLLLCDSESDKVNTIKKNDNKAILIKDGEEFDVVVEWEENPVKVEEIWNKFEEQGVNYFGSPDNLFSISIEIV